MKIKLGISDGLNTVITADGLSEGQEVVTGEIAEIAQPDTKNPFVPQLRRR